MAWAGYSEVAQILLDNGADVSAIDNAGNTPLQVANAKGHTEVAKLLRRHKKQNREPSTGELSADSIEMFDAELNTFGYSNYLNFRLRNKSQYSLKSVWITVMIYQDGRQIDMDEIHLNAPLTRLPPPSRSKSYREIINMRFPKAKWTLKYKVTDVKAAK